MGQKILLDYFPNYLNTDSLFTKMSILGAPWTNDIGQDMDDAYFTMYSGIKNPTDFVLRHLDPNSNVANSLTIARIIFGIYGYNWSKLWSAFNADYSFLNDYDINESVKRTLSENRTINKEIETNDTRQVSETVNYGQNINTTENNKMYNYGFNSDSAVPVKEDDNISTTDYGGNDTTSSDESESGKTADNTSDNALTGEEINRTRSGNTGNYTYQELISKEFELWKWNFYKRVFDDTDKFLTLAVFSRC